jgi:hypothetical protein
MHNINDYEGVAADTSRSLSTFISRISRSKIALAILALAILAIGGLFLVNYPLQTIIVVLLMASVFILDRA